MAGSNELCDVLFPLSQWVQLLLLMLLLMMIMVVVVVVEGSHVIKNIQVHHHQNFHRNCNDPLWGALATNQRKGMN